MLKKFFSIIAFYKFRAAGVVFRELFFQAAKRAPFIKSMRIHVYDFDMHIPLKINGIGRALYVLQGRESDHKWMMDMEVHKGDVILDLGANIGYYALMEAKRLQGAGKIHAIEPDPRNINFLEKNISSFGLQNLIDVREGAISNFNGEMDFALSDATNLSSFNTSIASASKIVKVKVYDFGGYIECIGKIDLVRMDVEGHEVQILQSLVEFLKRNKALAPRKIIFETHEYGAKQLQMANTLRSLFENGYAVKYLASDDELWPGGSVFKKYGYSPFKVLEEWGVSRGLYRDIRAQDAIKLISDWRGTRTVCLEFSPSDQSAGAAPVSV